MLMRLLAGLSLVAFSTAALADGTDAGGAAQSGPISGLAEIVVTAQRRAEDIQTTPVPVQAISGEQLVGAGVAQPEDLSSIATGLNIGTGGNLPQIYIRGVGNYSVNFYAEGAVAYNLDGVYLSRQWEDRGTLFDLDRVEVLKGPQGTLYGRNATGGAINLITAKPRLGRFDGYVEAEGGNYGLSRFTGAVNVPITDVFAARLAGQVINRDGYLSDGADDDHERSGRLHLLYEPGENFSVLLTGEYERTDGRGSANALVPPLSGSAWRSTSDPSINAIVLATPFIGPLLQQAETDSFLDTTVRSVSGALNWNFGAATLTVIPAYRDGTYSDRFYQATYRISEAEYAHQTSVEARLAHQSNRIKWVFGGFYFNEDQGNQPNQYMNFTESGLSGQTTSHFRGNTSSAAAFGDTTLTVADSFRLIAGVRFTYEHRNEDGANIAYNSFLPPPVPPFTCAPGSAFTPTSPIKFAPCAIDAPLFGSLNYTNVTWRGGFEYDLAPHSMLYATVSTGFKSGGFNFAPPPNTFKPEKVTAYELGLKNRFLENRLQANVDIFYWRYVDKQEAALGPTSIPGYFTLLTQNAGNARTSGAELSVIYQPVRSDRFTFDAQYNPTKYESFTYSYPSYLVGPPVVGCKVGPFSPVAPQTVNCAGFPLTRAPLWTGNAGYEHTFSLPNADTITARVNSAFSSGYYTVIDFLPIEYQKSFATLNADLTYTSSNGKWLVSAWGRNLTGRAIYDSEFRSPYISAANPLANPEGFVYGYIRPPRTYGVRVRVNF